MNRHYGLVLGTTLLVSIGAGIVWVQFADRRDEVVTEASYAVGGDPVQMSALSDAVVVARLLKSEDRVVRPDGPDGPELLNQVQTWSVIESLKGAPIPGDAIGVAATVRVTEAGRSSRPQAFPRPPGEAERTYVLFLRSLKDASDGAAWTLAGRPGMGELRDGVLRLWEVDGIDYSAGPQLNETDLRRIVAAAPPPPRDTSDTLEVSPAADVLAAAERVIAALSGSPAADVAALSKQHGLQAALAKAPELCQKTELLILQRTGHEVDLSCR